MAVSGASTNFKAMHFTRDFRNSFISSLSEPISQAIICSPYFGKLPDPYKDVLGFCNYLQGRGTEDIQIITRPPGADAQALPVETAKQLDARGVEIYIRPNPYLHAKLYHFEYRKGFFRTFVGSANFTIGGFAGNHEIVAELEGAGKQAPPHVEIQRLQKAGSAVTFREWVARGRPLGAEQVKI